MAIGAGHRQVGDVHIIRLQREERQHDRCRIGDRADAEVDFGRQNDEGEADRDDRGDRHLLQNILEIVESREGGTRDAEEDDEKQQRDERRDIAQLVAQKIAEAKRPGRGADIGALRVHYSRNPVVKPPPAGGPC